MFYSSYVHNVDAKGRIFIPARWRCELSDTVVITIDESKRDKAGFLQCMSQKEWEKYIETYAGILRTEEKPLSLLRVMMSKAFPCDVDKQGRIVLPQNLREYAGITETVQLNGMVDRVEIWNPDSWAAYEDEVTDTREDRLEAVTQALRSDAETKA